MAGAPLGNCNEVKGKRWKEAILRALSRANGTIDAGLDKAAEKLVALAAEGDRWAIDHIADRIDGKATQVLGNDGTLPAGISVAFALHSDDSVSAETTLPVQFN